MDRLGTRRPEAAMRRAGRRGWPRYERPPAREIRLVELRSAERRRNRQRLEVELPLQSSAAEAAGTPVVRPLVRAAVLGVVAWLLIEVVLPLLLQLAGAPYD